MARDLLAKFTGAAPHPSSSGTVPESMPVPVPLGRETRDPAAAARMAAQQAADNEQQMADSSVVLAGQTLGNARVSAADVGVAFLPGASQDQALSSRTSAPGYGSTVSTRLQASTSLVSAVDFYRKDLAEKWPGVAVVESRTGPSLVTLTASSAAAGLRVTVLLDASGPGPLSVSLTRWSERVAAAPAPAASGGR